ncbi:MAG: asparagine synthetase B [Bacteroidetes bacterium]|nr:MAG: asparagine synthetase B [Bacteroidota bacterium]REJ99685.1 MAG: asparagine synthetase B [Bacteroidota bacterium]REK33918.1 MAG: asparagine synthetase B [Bacteroidota bacterium]REK47683.1 MAG: asparagine synthetase B [Bacteroidota bacterium]
MKKIISLLSLLLVSGVLQAAYILVPMDQSQRNHLKAYGIAYFVLQHDVDVSWLLNYRGGSFLFITSPKFEQECTIRGVSFQLLADVQAASIIQELADPEVNKDVVKLEKAPKVAVYTPKSKLPWDDAVTLAMTYSEIPYDIVYDEEVLAGKLPLYDWLHLHHEDFTGQYGRFYAAYRNAAWYQEDQRSQEARAGRLGFQKVSQMKLAVALKIREFVAGGGYLFAMCSATDSYDIALSAQGVDICESMFDGDPADPKMNTKLDYTQTFAFKDYKLSTNPYEYEFSEIDNQPPLRKIVRTEDFFTLFDFSAKWDPVPTMLCQNHEQVIKGFMGQTTAFRKKFVKSEVLVMGETKLEDEARYIHGEFGKGTWTFYGGHDPEDYQHQVGDPPTDLSLHPNSPGYRLILNNILFPAARKKKQKT